MRGVAVIGGGSSGTYAAVQLKRAGYSAAAVEKTSMLGIAPLLSLYGVACDVVTFE